MATKYLDTMMTNSVRRVQKHYYGRAANISEAPERDPLDEAEAEFISTRDSFYLGTVSETGWPYIQHRGGPRGFLQVLNPTTLAFADYQGNRQLLSTGNLAVNDRVSLFLIDYPTRTRLKILGHAKVEDAESHPDLTGQLSKPGEKARVERIIFIDVVSFDWNCQKHITPRYSIEEVEELAGSLKARIAELETELHAARAGSGFAST
ncbi:MAG: Flavodoxin reductases (ferredoxin-NADPH reductases) family 1 [Nitrospira sp.]|jgi:predicted pyridoxine 5'-phosphate oxidase superfamily flavin-nucleotide-binding protein|nr:Flavodoxin reductases (ferredoxin-NADPH reductases) family 1 [Nitrospira sp.]